MIKRKKRKKVMERKFTKVSLFLKQNIAAPNAHAALRIVFVLQKGS